MNKVIICGRLCKSPEVRYSNGGTAIGRYTLAVDRKYKKDGEPTADFINCVCFGRSAEFAEKYLKKGTKIIVEGHIQTGSYEKDGHKVYTTDIIVESQEFAESKKSEEPQPTPSPVGDGFVNIPEGLDEELPFV